MKKVWMWLALAIMSVAMVTGCGDKIDANRPIADVKAEAATLDAKQLQAKIDACTAQLDKIKAQVQKEVDKIKALPLVEQAAATAKNAENAAALNKQIDGLTAQLKVYADALKTKK